MLEQTSFAVLALLVLLIGWLVMRLWRRRRTHGRVTEVERRYKETLAKFHVEIDRFKFARQGSVKVLLNHDHAIWTHVEELANETGESRDSLRMRVYKYVEEIVPFFRPLAYYSFGFNLSKWILNLLYRIDFAPEELAKIKEYTSQRPRSVIYLMNHRSNVDYVLAAYVLAEKLALSFAVGEWARVWPLEYLFKSFGSYFLRRGFRDPLYHTVLRRYVQLVTKNAVTQAMFPEGGLSRDGRLRAPKIGLIDSIITSKADRSFRRELIFVPVACNYDRVLEDRALVSELGKKKGERGRTSKTAMLARVWRILFGNVMKFARREIRKNGFAAVRFGEPLSFDAWHKARGVDIFSLSKESRRAHVSEFCNEMHRRIAALVPATPLSIVAKVLVAHAPLSRNALIVKVDEEMKRLDEMGVPRTAPERDAEWVVDGALLRFSVRHVLQEDDGDVIVPPEQMPVLTYYANSIAHHYDGIVPEVVKPEHIQAPASPALEAAAR